MHCLWRSYCLVIVDTHSVTLSCASAVSVDLPALSSLNYSLPLVFMLSPSVCLASVSPPQHSTCFVVAFACLVLTTAVHGITPPPSVPSLSFHTLAGVLLLPIKGQSVLSLSLSLPLALSLCILLPVKAFNQSVKIDSLQFSLRVAGARFVF